MNRGGLVDGTPNKSPLKDGGAMAQSRATKSGRKVKRPAHFDDSPDAVGKKQSSSMKADGGLEDVASPKRKEVPDVAKKSARKTILKSHDGTPTKNGETEPEPVKKSARKTLLKQESEQEPEPAKKSSRKTLHKQESEQEPEPAKKSSRKTLHKQEPEREQELEEVKKSSHKTMVVKTTPTKEESPEPEVVKKSARKTLLKSAVKNASADHETQNSSPSKNKKADVESPTWKKSVRKVEQEEEAPAGTGVSRTGRKIKVPSHLKEFEDVVTAVASPKKETPSSRKSTAPIVVLTKRNEPEPEEKVAPKTPGRGRSMVVRKEAEPEEEKVPSKTPSRRGKSLAPAKTEEEDDPLDLPVAKEDKFPAKTPSKRGKSVVAPREPSPEPAKKVEAKTPRRGKSLAPEVIKSSPKEEKPAAKRNFVMAPRDLSSSPKEEPNKTPKRGKSMAPLETVKSPPSKEENFRTKTPFKRGKSLAPAARDPSPRLPPKTPKAASKLVEDSTEPMSRSGRKIKPKKFFGEFEEEEPPVAIISKAAASPAKPVAKSSPVVKKDASSPKRSSPLKRLALPEKSKPEAAAASPPKRTKLEVRPTALKSPKVVDKISPNSEERQITKRGVNDHHQHLPHDEIAEVMEKDPLGASSEESISIVPSSEGSISTGLSSLESSSTEPSSVEELSKETLVEAKPVSAEKTKRGRKTLPARDTGDDADEPEPKAPKTPTARRTLAAAPVVALEEASSSRSGRKIKPKKFFDGEPVAASVVVSASKPKPVAATPGAGRGRRKTLAPELEKTDETESKPEPEEEKVEPAEDVQSVPSREEILAVVGAADPPVVEETEEEQQKLLPVEENKQLQKDEKEEEPNQHKDLSQDDVTLPTEELPETLIGNGQESAPVVGEDELTNDESIQESVDGERLEPETPEEPKVADVEEDVEQELQEAENTEPKTEGNFPEARVEPTSPPAHPTEEVPNDPVLLAEEPPVVENPVVEEEEHEAEPNNETACEKEAEPTIPELETAEIIEQEPQQVTEPEPTQVTEPVAALVEQESQQVIELEADSIEQEPQEVTLPEMVEVLSSEAESIAETAVEEQAAIDDAVQETDEQDVVAQEAVNQDDDVQEVGQQTAEISASSIFSEGLLVDDENSQPPTAVNKSAENFESVEFLEESAEKVVLHEDELLNDVPAEIRNVQEEEEETAEREQVVTPDLEDELDKTEPPEMDDLDGDKEDEDDLLEEVVEPTEGSFDEKDRGNDCILVLPETPKKTVNLEEVELIEKVPLPHSSQTTIAMVEVSEQTGELSPAVPKTPESKATKPSETFSPDKPDDQEVANVPVEIIEIPDSPIVTLLQPAVTESGKSGSATSTPIRTHTKLTVKERLIQNSRKRSLSASDAEIAKKNVTFHSPANSTILVDTIDERLKKSFKIESSGSKTDKNHRKRSLSEHRDVGNVAAADGVKPAKISKLPNFKVIHQQQFSKMESIEQFHNRKVQRAKELTSSASKSPAAAAFARNERHPVQKSSTPIGLAPKSPHKTGNGTASSTHVFGSASKATIVRPVMTGKPVQHKPLSDAERLEKRQKQFHTAFKPKSSVAGGSSSTEQSTTDGAHRVIEQSRHKQSQILKGVRTNKRFELLMKFRDAQE